MDPRDPNSVEYVLLDPTKGLRRVTRRRFYWRSPTDSQSTGEWVELQREAKRVEEKIERLKVIRDVRESNSGLGSK